MIGTLWRRLLTWLNSLMGDSAQARLQRLIADKLDDLSATKKAQLLEMIAVQKEKDDVAVEKYRLALKSKRLATKAEGMSVINLSRLDQFQAELDEYRSNLTALHLLENKSLPVTQPTLEEPNESSESNPV